MTLFDQALAHTSPIHFWHNKDQIESWEAPQLLAKARAISAQFRSLGVGAGDVVVLMLPTCADLIASVLAVWGCRAAVCIVPHHIGGQPGRLSHLKLNAILDLLDPRLIVHAMLQPDSIDHTTAHVLNHQQLANDPVEEFTGAPTASDVAIMQLTSGSTQLPKALPLRHDQVRANVLAIVERVGIFAADHIVSWLPLHHDMGLSALTVALETDARLSLIPAERFVRSPPVWLEAISRQGGTISPCPTFAYALLTKFARRMSCEEIDLSRWRYAWIGAEPISAKHIADFERAMRPFGLKPNVVQPAYGLAEAVVAVSCNAPGVPYRLLSIDGRLLREKARVQEVGTDDPNALTLVSNGRPVPGALVNIRRTDGSPADIDEQGHMWISGPFVATGYFGGADAERFCDGWHDTGDLGFMFDGEVYISGRAKDVIIRGGVNTSPSHVEWVIEQLLDLRPAQVVAFSHMNPAHAQEEVVVVVGLRPPEDERQDVIRRITVEVAEQVGLTIERVIFTASGNIPKTTSGKVQRNTVREMFNERLFEETV